MSHDSHKETCEGVGCRRCLEQELDRLRRENKEMQSMLKLKSAVAFLNKDETLTKVLRQNSVRHVKIIGQYFIDYANGMEGK